MSMVATEQSTAPDSKRPPKGDTRKETAGDDTGSGSGGSPVVPLGPRPDERRKDKPKDKPKEKPKDKPGDGNGGGSPKVPL